MAWFSVDIVSFPASNPWTILLALGVDDVVRDRRLFAKNGYAVAVLARNAEPLKALSESIKAEGGEVGYFIFTKSEVFLAEVFVRRLRSRLKPTPTKP